MTGTDSDEARPIVVAVCGGPGAGKTTTAAAIARELGVLLGARQGVPHVTQDEFKNGVGLSFARLAEAGELQLAPGFVVAGGPFSRRAQQVVVEVARLLASLSVSFVIETSVLSDALLDAIIASRARVLAVHVVARSEVIGQRLRARAAAGGPAARSLLEQFDRGELDESIFAPPDHVGPVTRCDTSDRLDPDIRHIRQAVMALLGPTAD